VILYELFSRTLLLYTHTPANSPNDSLAYAERVSQGFRPSRPRSFPADLWQVVERCWDPDPTARPPASWVLQQLQQLQEAEQAAAAAAAASSILGGLLARSKRLFKQGSGDDRSSGTISSVKLSSSKVGRRTGHQQCQARP